MNSGFIRPGTWFLISGTILSNPLSQPLELILLWMCIHSAQSHALLSVQFREMLTPNTCSFIESVELSEEDSFLIRVLLTGVVYLEPLFSRECRSFAEFAEEQFSFPRLSSGIGWGGEFRFLEAHFPLIVPVEIFADLSIIGSDDNSFLLDVLLVREGWILEMEVRQLNSLWEREFDRSCLALLTGKSSMESLKFSAFLFDDM